jgi:hypothetical protein
MFKKLLTASLVLLLTLVAAGTAFAADPFAATGTVASVGATSFEMDVEGTLYTVFPPEGFDLTTLMVGDTVDVEGEVELDVVTATSVVIVVVEEEVEYLKSGFYCENPDAVHPVVQKIADSQEVEYSEVLAFFCGTEEVGHNGLGGIKLAYKTSETLGDDTTAADILKMKEELGGWGKVWQYFGLIGNKPDQSDDGGGDPEIVDAADSNSHGKGNHGKPDHAGPPDHANNNKDKNKDKKKDH